MQDPDLLAKMKAYGEFLDRAIGEFADASLEAARARQSLAAMPLRVIDLREIAPREPAPPYPLAEAAE